MQASSNSELDSDVDSEDNHIDLIVNPAKQHLNLKEQRPHVQKVVIHAIRELEGHLCMVHAFPDAGTDSAVFIWHILANSAKAVGDSELRRILKNKKQVSYAKKLGSIVHALVSAVINLRNCSLATSAFVIVLWQGKEDNGQHGLELLQPHSW